MFQWKVYKRHTFCVKNGITLVQYALQIDSQRLQNTKLLQHINQLQFNNIN